MRKAAVPISGLHFPVTYKKDIKASIRFAKKTETTVQSSLFFFANPAKSGSEEAKTSRSKTLHRNPTEAFSKKYRPLGYTHQHKVYIRAKRFLNEMHLGM